MNRILRWLGCVVVVVVLQMPATNANDGGVRSDIGPACVPLHQLLDVDFDDLDVREVVTALANAAGCDVAVVLDVEFAGRVSLHLKGVSWSRALTAALEPVGLAWDRVGRYVVVRRPRPADVEPTGVEGDTP